MKSYPRIIVGSIGLWPELDQIARWHRDAGAEVVYLGSPNTVEQIVAVAIAEDADMIVGPATELPAIEAQLLKHGVFDIPVRDENWRTTDE